jgi:hypothetical protein
MLRALNYMLVRLITASVCDLTSSTNRIYAASLLERQWAHPDETHKHEIEMYEAYGAQPP